MRIVHSRQAQALTGLSADQLREWARRGLIMPDVLPNGPGSRAGYSWQTVLLLRLAAVLNKSFRVELQAQRQFFQELSTGLAKTSFPSLRGLAIVLRAQGEFELIHAERLSAITGNFLVLELESHLDLLSTEFGIADQREQLSLFPAVAVR